MDLAALVSGGKDSILAMYRMHLEGHRIRYLLSMEPESRESYMFHHPNVWVTGLISQATGIQLITARTPGRKEEELLDLRALFESVSSEVEGIVGGALASNYQKRRIDGLCEELSLKSLAPLWQIDPLELWQELFRHGFEVMITGVAAEGLDERWLGRVVDRGAFEELRELSERHRFHLGFEGGEAETLVLDMPLYRMRIAVKKGETLWEGSSGIYTIEEAVLEA
ncbi:MAG: diphthine--ammonia ligase [Methanobacteriota archaeon]|nr:MAG: diphthine--ammonia ligase [Euryarchaeota archaeon]